MGGRPSNSPSGEAHTDFVLSSVGYHYQDIWASMERQYSICMGSPLWNTRPWRKRLSKILELSWIITWGLYWTVYCNDQPTARLALGTLHCCGELGSPLGKVRQRCICFKKITVGSTFTALVFENDRKGLVACAQCFSRQLASTPRTHHYTCDVYII